MWQRIQTVFLIVAVIALLVSVIQPIWIIPGEPSPTVLTAFYLLSESVYNYFPYTLTAVLTIASVTIAIIEIGKFRDRGLQLKLGALNSLLMAGAVILSVYFSNELNGEFGGGQYGLGLYLPAVAVACNFLANRFIRRDEKIVRDSERLR